LENGFGLLFVKFHFKSYEVVILS